MEKWDWDKLVGYCPKKMQFAEWMIGDDGENQGSGHASSAKSSISDSSTKDPIEANKLEIKACTTSAEALLGLKLGKRTYFENNAVKKPKSSAQNTPLCCQVEGCNIDLSTAKEYHRKHRVCESHSKCPRVVVAGRERRFCQQCSRFHSLSEFDEKKRSCRRRLSDHNARRRKPQQETIRFDSTRHSTTLPFYGGNQEMSFVLNNSPVRNSGWDSACNSKFTLTQGYSLKSNGDEELRMMNMQNGVLASSSSMVSNPATEYRRALSLLSSNSWDHQQMHGSDSCIMQPMIPEVAPLELWASGQQDPTNSNSFQEIQLFKTPFDANFYSNILN